MIDLAESTKLWNGNDRRKSKKLLYLDDEADDLHLFKCRAESMGFHVTAVSYPSDFMREFETGVYDAAFVDFLLSTVDGVTLTRLLHKEKAPNTKIYIFTVYDKEEVMKKVNGDKINGVISKLDDGILKAMAEVANGRE
jgi:CheY-like chemotaxis protein